MRSVFQLFVALLLIAAPAAAGPIGPQDLNLAPQQWQINIGVTISGDVRLGPIVETPPAATPPVTETDCEQVMALYNEAAGQADRHEKTGAERQSGDGCALGAETPPR